MQPANCVWTVPGSQREMQVTCMARGIVGLVQSLGSSITEEAALAAATAIEERCYIATEAMSRLSGDTIGDRLCSDSESKLMTEHTTNYVRWVSKNGREHFIWQNSWIHRA